MVQKAGWDCSKDLLIPKKDTRSFLMRFDALVQTCLVVWHRQIGAITRIGVAAAANAV